ncbi:MAG: hypothetical protein WCF18_20400 [Chthoniobacteraceae bacterium]
MNPPIDPSKPAPSRSAGVPPLPTPPPPLPPDASPGLLIETLLKRPAQLIETLQQQGCGRLSAWLAIAALLALAAYGLVVGSFSGGEQLVAAPLKISLGALLSMLICLPSLFIFGCLTGAEVTLRGTIGVLCAVLALTAMLLIGFAPVAWVFSQSTESVAFIGALHLIFWSIALGFGLRLLRVFMDLLRVRDRVHLRVWSCIFILASFQMTTALRPIVGRSPHHFPTEKRFFLEHWFANIFDRAVVIAP